MKVADENSQLGEDMGERGNRTEAAEHSAFDRQRRERQHLRRGSHGIAASRSSIPRAFSCGQFTMNVPFTKPVNVMLGAMPTGENDPLGVSGAPSAICVAPGPRQFLYSADAVPGRIYKLTLDGKVVGVLGEGGRGSEQIRMEIHEIACPVGERGT